MVRNGSGDLRGQVRDYIRIDGLNQRLVSRIADYLTTLHSLGEGTKEVYLVRLRMFAIWLDKNGYGCFEDADKPLIDLFLSGAKNHGTINNYITTLKPFYRDFLKKPDVVKDLKYANDDLQLPAF